MELSANQPGVQFYTGNFLDGSVKGRGGATYVKHSGLCLETQKYPDAIHHPDWPQPVLRPGETYRHVMVHRFSTLP
jgi:aldose 1-epimerase